MRGKKWLSAASQESITDSFIKEVKWSIALYDLKGLPIIRLERISGGL